MSVYKKLQEARKQLQSVKMTKSGHNKFANYQYFELGDFLPHIVVIFNEIGLCSVVSFDDKVATLTLTDIDDGSSIVITSPMAEAQLKGCHPIQNLGAVETYQRRYLYVALMDIVEHDALDSSEPVKPKPESSKSIGQADYDNLSEDRKRYVDGVSEEIIAMANIDTDKAYGVWLDFKASEPAIEEITACSGKLPSHIRAAFKKIAGAK